MKNKILYFVAVAIMLSLSACSNEGIFEEVKSEVSTKTQLTPSRTITLTASMPEDEPPTRINLTQGADKNISLTWEVGDKLQLAFVQGTTKVKQTVVLTSDKISNQGTKASFDIVMPDEIAEGAPFDLFGVYGGGNRMMNIEIGVPSGGEAGVGTIKHFYNGDALELGDESTNPYIKLPSNVAYATSLAGEEPASVKNRKDVILYFESKNIDATNPQISVIFQHLGSLFSITFKNVNTDSNADVTYVNDEIRLAGMGEDVNWAYNNALGGQTFDLIMGKFLNTESAGNYISFRIPKNTVLKTGESITLWAWYPPLPKKT